MRARWPRRTAGNGWRRTAPVNILGGYGYVPMLATVEQCVEGRAGGCRAAPEGHAGPRIGPATASAPRSAARRWSPTTGSAPATTSIASPVSFRARVTSWRDSRLLRPDPRYRERRRRQRLDAARDGVARRRAAGHCPQYRQSDPGPGRCFRRSVHACRFQRRHHRKRSAGSDGRSRSGAAPVASAVGVFSPTDRRGTRVPKPHPKMLSPSAWHQIHVEHRIRFERRNLPHRPQGDPSRNRFSQEVLGDPSLGYRRSEATRARARTSPSAARRGRGVVGACGGQRRLRLVKQSLQRQEHGVATAAPGVVGGRVRPSRRRARRTDLQPGGEGKARPRAQHLPAIFALRDLAAGKRTRFLRLARPRSGRNPTRHRKPGVSRAEQLPIDAPAQHNLLLPESPTNECCRPAAL